VSAASDCLAIVVSEKIKTYANLTGRRGETRDCQCITAPTCQVSEKFI